MNTLSSESGSTEPRFFVDVWFAGRVPDVSSIQDIAGAKPDVFREFENLDWPTLITYQLGTGECTSFQVRDSETKHDLELYLQDHRESVRFYGVYTFPVVKKKWFGFTRQNGLECLGFSKDFNIDETRHVIELFLNEAYRELVSYVS